MSDYQVPDSILGKTPIDEPGERSLLARGFGALLLIAAVGVQIAAPLTDRPLIPVPRTSFWDLQDTPQLLSWMGEFSRFLALDTLRFFAVGLLVPFACQRSRSLFRSLGRLIVAALLVVGIRAAEARGIPVPVRLLLPIPAALFGCWIGLRWVQGGSARKWLIPQLILLLVAVGGGLAWCYFNALQTTPLAVDAVDVSTAEKRRVVNLLRDARNSKDKDHETRTVELAERDVNFLLAWGLSLGSAGRRAAVELDDHHVAGAATFAVPVPGAGERFLNLQAGADVDIQAGQLQFDLQTLRVGALQVPAAICRGLSFLVTSTVRTDPDLQRTLAAVDKLEITPKRVQIVDRAGDLNTGLVARLLRRFGEQPDVIEATEYYLRHLTAAADGLPAGGDERFLALLQSAFSAAQDRSQQGDPVLENRAALFALGILAGHGRVKHLVGVSDVPDGAGKQLRPLTIRGRGDWTQHFLVSASVTLLSNAATGNAVGLLKEELDADGGSGFSFADLLADRAGVRFAGVATRDAESARALQQHLAGTLWFDEFFPPAGDLPEGLSDAEFKDRYGGVGGAGYKEQLAEIDRRLDATPLLK